MDRASRLLEETLAASRMPSADRLEGLAEEARDYYWVQYRDGPGSGWRDVHPAFADAAVAPRQLSADTYFADEVPERLQHRFRLRVFLETREEGGLRTTQIVPDWQRPSANLVGRSFNVFNLPNGLRGNPFELDLDQALNESDLFVPLFNGQVLPGTLGFDLDGQRYDMDAQGLDGFGAAGTMRTARQKTARAVEALRGLGEADDRPRRISDVTGQWIEYALIAPDGAEKTFRRYLIDRIGPARRASGDAANLALEALRPWRLIASESFAVIPGRIPGALIVEELADALDAKAALVGDIKERGAPTPQALAEAAEASSGPDALDFFALARLFDQGLEPRQPGHTYRPEPTIIAAHLGARDADRIAMSTDIVSSVRRSRDTGDALAGRNLLRQGVWESLAERRLLDAAAEGRETVRTSFSLFEDSRDGGGLLALRSPRSPQALSRLGVPSDQAQLISAALHEGKRVVLLPGQNRDRLAWWQFDPETGSAIGYLPSGRGATAVEYLVLVGGFAGLLVLAITGFGKCLAHWFNEAWLCFSLVDSHKARTENVFGYCIAAQAQFREPELPPYSCVCGGIGEEPCREGLGEELQRANRNR